VLRSSTRKSAGESNGLIERAKKLYMSFPLPEQRPSKTWTDYGPLTFSYNARRQFLDCTYDEFLLRRLLVQRLGDDPLELLVVANEMLSTILLCRTRGGSQSAVSTAWSIVVYGLPAAGVLALELLQLNQCVISHAKIKQTLCVFISYLEWVHVPGDGNYQLVEKARKTLQHIMDQVLNTPPPMFEQQQQGNEWSFPFLRNDAEDLGLYDFSWFDDFHLDQDSRGHLGTIEQVI